MACSISGGLFPELNHANTDRREIDVLLLTAYDWRLVKPAANMPRVTYMLPPR